MYEDLKEQVDNLDTVLAEYGYHYEESDSEQENHSRYCIIAYALQSEQVLYPSERLIYNCTVCYRDMVVVMFFSLFRNNSQDQANHNQANDSILNTEEMLDEMEVEFTPHLTWKCKAKSRDSDRDSHDTSQRNPIIRGIATPVIKSLQSVLQSEILNQRNHL